MLLLSFDSIGLSVQEKKRKNRFSRWPPCWPAWISIGTIFASLNLQVNPTPSRRAPNPQIFLPRFESVGLSVQEKKRKIDFQDDRPQISNRNDFSFFFFIYKSTILKLGEKIWTNIVRHLRTFKVNVKDNFLILLLSLFDIAICLFCNISLTGELFFCSCRIFFHLKRIIIDISYI